MKCVAVLERLVVLLRDGHVDESEGVKLLQGLNLGELGCYKDGMIQKGGRMSDLSPDLITTFTVVAAVAKPPAAKPKYDAPSKTKPKSLFG